MLLLDENRLLGNFPTLEYFKEKGLDFGRPGDLVDNLFYGRPGSRTKESRSQLPYIAVVENVRPMVRPAALRSPPFGGVAFFRFGQPGAPTNGVSFSTSAPAGIEN